MWLPRAIAMYTFDRKRAASCRSTAAPENISENAFELPKWKGINQVVDQQNYRNLLWLRRYGVTV